MTHKPDHLLVWLLIPSEFSCTQPQVYHFHHKSQWVRKNPDHCRKFWPLGDLMSNDGCSMSARANGRSGDIFKCWIILWWRCPCPRTSFSSTLWFSFWGFHWLYIVSLPTLLWGWGEQGCKEAVVKTSAYCSPVLLCIQSKLKAFQSLGKWVSMGYAASRTHNDQPVFFFLGDRIYKMK